MIPNHRQMYVLIWKQQGEDGPRAGGGTRTTISWYGSRDARTAGSPERGDMGTTTNYRQRLLDRGRGFKPRGKNSVTPGTINKHETFADIFSTAAIQENHRRKTPSQQNKQFDPGGRVEKAPPWKAAVTLPSFSGESWKAPCLLSVCASCSVLCVCLFPKLFFSSQVILRKM